MEQAETITGKAGVNLKIILKYILTNVKERKARTFVMLLSIQLSAMLLFVSFSIGVSYEIPYCNGDSISASPASVVSCFSLIFKMKKVTTYYTSLFVTFFIFPIFLSV